MEDVSPVLLEKIQKDFQTMFDKSAVISDLYARVRDGTATYKEANEFAIEAGNILASAYGSNLSSDVLPDGKMYYNIAEKIIQPTLNKDYEIISEFAEQVQTSMNEAAGIGIKAIKPEMNQDNMDNIMNRIASEDNFDTVAWMLDAPVVNFCQSIIDDAVRVNAEFHSKAGLNPVIKRKVSGNCCEWCKNLAGAYNYLEDMPDGIFRRHNNCNCTVEYDPKDGKIQNVHTKQWRNAENSDKIETRKKILVDSDKDAKKTEYRKKVGVNGLSYNESRALTNYVSSDAYVINDKLRRAEELSEQEMQFCRDLDAALKKMPSYEGNLSRSIFFYDDQDADAYAGIFEENGIVRFKEYISTTKGTELYNPEGQVQIFIQDSQKGKDISQINEMEQEVLYERNSEFGVVSKVKQGNVWYILLKEV